MPKRRSLRTEGEEMRVTEQDVKTSINSEIHASLRRLEEADYVSETILSGKLNTLAGQLEEVDQRLTASVNKLYTEVYGIHDFLEPHIMDSDLCLFQNVYTGYLQVESGASIGGSVTFTDESLSGGVLCKGHLTVDDGLQVNGDNGMFVKLISMPDENDYTPHTLTIEGTTLDGYILASEDLTFSFAGLVEGSWSGTTYTVETTTNHIELASTTIAVQASISYDTTAKKYIASASLIDPDTEEPFYETSGDENAESEVVTPETHTKSAKLYYIGRDSDNNYTYRTTKNLGTTSSGKTVYYK